MCIISCKVYEGIKKEDRNFMRLIWNRLKDFWHYRDLLKQLIIRDIKLKYRRSFLGYLWSVLNPLFLMLVMTIVFSQMFRRNIENFPVYSGLYIGRNAGTIRDFRC